MGGQKGQQINTAISRLLHCTTGSSWSMWCLCRGKKAKGYAACCRLQPTGRLHPPAPTHKCSSKQCCRALSKLG